MFPRLALFLVVSSVGVLFPCLGSGQQKKEPVAVIVSPKEGAKVERFGEVEGKLHTKKGWPVVLVQPLVGDEPWWVQPPVKEVEDGAFTVAAYFGNDETTPGTKFRVVIVVAKNKAEAHKLKAGMTLMELPALPRSEPVTAVRNTARDGERPAKPRVIQFAGRSWEVKRGRHLGPGPNNWSDAEEHVRLDDKGHLNLAIAQTGGRWQCAEVVATQSLGYGVYRWVISGDLPALDPRVVLGLFVYENDRREIDFELSRWGEADNANAQFVIQPYGKDSMHRFDTGKAKVLNCSLVWEKTAVRGRCWAGVDTTREPLADWKYTGRKIPPPGNERARMNLWLFRGKAPAAPVKEEIVIQSFEFKPAAPEKNH